MSTVDPPWPGPLQPWDVMSAPDLFRPSLASHVVPLGCVSGNPAFSPWACKHCGKQPIPDGGPHWCPASAAEAHEKAIADAVALLERSGYVVAFRAPDAADEPWAFESES